MEWSAPRKAKEAVSHYDHVTMWTPLGICIIEWKSWKESPDYSVTINESYIGTEYSLEKAKEIAINHLIGKFNELKNFLPQPPQQG